MNTPKRLQTSVYPEKVTFFLLLAAVSIALCWVVWPLLGALMWGVIIALLFAPLFRRLLRHLHRHRTIAALLTMLLVLVLAIIPFALVTASLASQASWVYEQIESGQWNPAGYFHRIFDALPDWAMSLLDRFGLANFNALQRRLTAALAQGSQFLATNAVSIGLSSFDFIASLMIALYLAFYLIRDGDAVLRRLHQAIPLAPATKQELLRTFATVTRATVRGNLLVATIQGALGGLAFWFLDVSAALLWAVLMAFLSLLPAIGAGLVWLPVALYLLATGAVWQSAALVAWGVLVIGLIDNLLRPLLVGQDTGMPDYVVMITTLGGLAVFGINGFVLGPVIAALFIAVWRINGDRPASTP